MIKIKLFKMSRVTGDGCQTWEQLDLVLQADTQAEMELVQRRICGVLSVGKHSTISVTEEII